MSVDVIKMFLSIQVFLLLFIFATGSRRADTSSCQAKVYKAAARNQFFTSPKYPRKFAEQTQCNWIVQAPLGYRVHLTFQSFYLLGTYTQDQCFVQHITITDPYTGIQDGPYCGNTTPPPTISAGRVLKVTLESDAVGITEIYRGFKVRFATSLRLPSPRMRDSGGLWTRYRLTLNGATLPTYTTTLRAVSTRNPNEVDSNNNAAIDIRNSRQNNQPTSNSNEERNRRINDENNRNIVSPTVIVTARPDRFVFHRRTIRTPTRNRVKYRPQPSTPSRRNPNKEAKKRLSEGVIAGIVVGLLVIIVVLSGTVYKIVSRRKKQNETHQQEVANYIQVENSQIPTDHLANDLGHKNNAYSGPVVHSSPVTNMNKEPGGKVRHCGDKISLNVVEPPKIHTTRKSDQNTQQSSNQQRQTRKKTPRNNRVHKRRETSQKGRSRRQDTSRAKRSRKQSHPKQRSRDISKNTDRPKNRA